MEDKKYNVFMRLLNFNHSKYAAEKIFSDFIKLFAINLSNKVVYNEKNGKMYEEIYKAYEKTEQCYFYALSMELTRIFCAEKDPYDILGEIYQQLTKKNYLNLIDKNNTAQEFGKKLQGIININNKAKNGKMLEMNCGSGAMILAYASTLKMFKLDYRRDLQVTAVDYDILNVFMTYIQLYFYEINATVILVNKENNKELMRLHTPTYENEGENAMAA